MIELKVLLIGALVLLAISMILMALMWRNSLKRVHELERQLEEVNAARPRIVSMYVVHNEKEDEHVERHSGAA